MKKIELVKFIKKFDLSYKKVIKSINSKQFQTIFKKNKLYIVVKKDNKRVVKKLKKTDKKSLKKTILLQKKIIKTKDSVIKSKDETINAKQSEINNIKEVYNNLLIVFNELKEIEQKKDKLLINSDDKVVLNIDEFTNKLKENGMQIKQIKEFIVNNIIEKNIEYDEDKLIIDKDFYLNCFKDNLC